MFKKEWWQFNPFWFPKKILYAQEKAGTFLQEKREEKKL